MPVAVDRLRATARDYELSSLAAQERGDADAARMFTCVAITLFETADALEETSSE